MAYKIAFFGAKPYDIASFDKVNEKYNYDIRYYKGHLNPNNVVLTQDTVSYTHLTLPTNSRV